MATKRRRRRSTRRNPAAAAAAPAPRARGGVNPWPLVAGGLVIGGGLLYAYKAFGAKAREAANGDASPQKMGLLAGATAAACTAGAISKGVPAAVAAQMCQPLGELGGKVVEKVGQGLVVAGKGIGTGAKAVFYTAPKAVGHAAFSVGKAGFGLGKKVVYDAPKKVLTTTVGLGKAVVYDAPKHVVGRVAGAGKSAVKKIGSIFGLGDADDLAAYAALTMAPRTRRRAPGALGMASTRARLSGARCGCHAGRCNGCDDAAAGYLALLGG